MYIYNDGITVPSLNNLMETQKLLSMCIIHQSRERLMMKNHIAAVESISNHNILLLMWIIFCAD